MKKIIYKLKKNRLVSKITCFSVILMILISSLTVSSFAADEEVSVANEEVNSITDTWTSILNWITGSLSSVQNVFFTGGSVRFYPDFVDLGGNGLIYNIANMPDPLPDTFYVYDGFETVIFNLVDLEPSQSNFYATRGYVSVANPDIPLIFYITDSSSPWSGWVVDGDLVSLFNFVEISYSTDSIQLTFLGTLSVVGVAIAVILLLISVIINFLKLRG